MSVVMTFNSVTSTTMGLTITDVQKPLMPPQKDVTVNVPGSSGVTQFSKKFIDNKIVVKCILIGTSYADLVTKLISLSGYLYSDEDKLLSFDDETGKEWNAQHIDTVVVKKTYKYAWLDLVFSCNDPFGYATTATSDDQTITVNPTTKVIANAGQYYVFPVVTITFVQAQTHIYVENDNISENRFDISKTFDIGDVLVVDCKNKTVKLNGTADYSGFGSGGDGLAEWLMLNTGNNSITIGSTDATISITVNISFDKTYLY